MRPAVCCLMFLLLTGCTQATREQAAKDWCSSASNCTVYDENGRESSDNKFCRGNRNCISP